MCLSTPDVATARQPDAADDPGRCVRSVAVLPVSGRPETVRRGAAAAAVAAGPAAPAPARRGGGAATDVLRPRGAHHAAVQARTQLLRQQVHVPVEQPRLQPSHVEVNSAHYPVLLPV